jgi:hypothetical protein
MKEQNKKNIKQKEYISITEIIIAITTTALAGYYLTPLSPIVKKIASLVTAVLYVGSGAYLTYRLIQKGIGLKQMLKTSRMFLRVASVVLIIQAIILIDSIRHSIQ